MKKLVFVLLWQIFIGEIFAQTQTPETQSFIRSIYFGGGSYDIDNEQINELYRLIDSIPHIERYQISITSHTDNIGGKAYNEWLSKMRSEMVVDYLRLKKIPPDNIFIKDFGQENPAFDNDTHHGRIRNRRVDIVFSPLTL